MSVAAVVGIIAGIFAILTSLCTGAYFLWKVAQAVGEMKHELSGLADTVRDTKELTIRMAVAEAKLDGHLRFHGHQ